MSVVYTTRLEEPEKKYVGAGASQKGHRTGNILIDAGKTFYESALLVFPKYGLRQIDALLLSHNHCDAANGLDDLRGWTLGGFVQEYIDVYCDQATFHSVRTMFPFLVDISKATGGGDLTDQGFKWHVIDPIEPFQIEAGGIQVQALQVEHGFYSSGLPYYCLGFRIGEFSYISDTSAVPERTKTLLHGTKVLVLDALRDKPHPSHFSINQALGFVKSLHPPPLQTYLTGFSHDVNHYELEKRLVKDTSINITPCFDGQKVELDYC
ncbi:putative hydrolase [Neolecta irregularis DAH-3]|uniref:Putative hydrolase n=1 Tax=Neolecta irregularis (strain DAH-3) TaxID=1198029 RepID=A0A1U7LSV8_NEOID|nr:putative hydrolase [Neolecta irregularis DAH-3]|eukprot:OLL25755.1 putative hydrolase [Neolecta irregularis DAH-3]